MPVVSGQEQLRALGLRLKAAGDGGLKSELRKGIRVGAAPLVAEVRQAARTQLPKAGGLNNYVADSKISVSIRLSGRLVGVRIVNSRPNVKKGGTRDFGSDRGEVRHPVYGNRKRKWAVTKVQPGWFSKTLTDRAPEVAPDVLAAMEATARAITLKGF